MKESVKISIVILNWNQYNDTAECLDSIRKIEHPDFEIILVDNGSVDGSGLSLKKEYPEINLVQNDENLGWAGGSNAGIQYSLDRGSDYILLLKPLQLVEEFSKKVNPIFYIFLSFFLLALDHY